VKTIKEIADALRDPLGVWNTPFGMLYMIVTGDSVPSYTSSEKDYQVLATTLAKILDRCVELPLDREGVPIRPGDEVSCRGNVARVGSCQVEADGNWLVLLEDGFPTRSLAGISHVLPDSFERIVDDALGWQATEENRKELLRRCREVAGRG